jgi:hypothetical protein
MVSPKVNFLDDFGSELTVYEEKCRKHNCGFCFGATYCIQPFNLLKVGAEIF